MVSSILFGLVVNAGPVAAQTVSGVQTPGYKKPFLTSGGAAIGGYMDMEFKADGDGSTFDQHRFVPFIFAEVSDRVHVASEIEFEHGGFVAGDKDTGGEIKLEFATVDFAITPALNFRGGVILSPLGRLNVFHDAPMLDLTERPLVTRYIIPTTLSESGMGFFGVVYPSETMVLEYEAYLVNGFGPGAVQDSLRILDIRGARGSQKNDNNNSRAFVGRLGVSPRLGTEFGVSVHTGDYDDEGVHNLTVAAVDARFARGAFELLGEGALARGEYQGSVSTETATAKAVGFYLEGRLHLLAGAWNELPQSVLTAVVRVDYVDRDRTAVGLDDERLTLGVNFRPTEETVFKNDILFDRGRASGVPEWGDTETAYRFSIATYF